MVPLERVVYVIHGVGSRIERREHLAVGEIVPRDGVAADAGLDVEAVSVQVQQTIREDVATVVAEALRVVHAHVLGVARPVGAGDFDVAVRPVELRHLACHHSKLP